MSSFSRGPIPAVAVGLLAGQLVAGVRWELPASALVAAIAAGGTACLPRRTRLLGLLILAAVFGFLQVRSILRTPTDPQHIVARAPGAARVRARIVEPPRRGRGRTRFVLEVEAIAGARDWNTAHGGLLLTVIHTAKPWEAGSILEGTLRLRRPRNFGNPGEFDYEAYLARRRIFVTAFAYDDAMLALHEAPASWPWSLATVRHEVAAALRRSAGSPEREILAALLLGDRDEVPERIREVFAAAGIAHVLAISGLHVGMVGGAGLLVSWWLLARSRRLLLLASVPKLAAGASFLCVLFYAGLARGSVATTRSVLMVAVLVAGTLLDRRRDAIVALGTAAVAISLIWPGSVLDVSFQLSFSAVLALILGTNLFWTWWTRLEERRLLLLRGRHWRWIGVALASILVSFWATIGTAPLTALHFNRVSLAALVANPIIVPLLGTGAVALGLAGGIAALVYAPLAAWLLAAAALSVRLGVSLAEMFAALPGASWRVVTPSALEIALFYALVLFPLALRGRSRRIAFAAVLAAIAVDVGVALENRYGRDKLEVTFLSVGQGDATVIRFPGDEVMLVDGGGLFSFDTGAGIIAPYLWRRKIARVDYVVLTHPQRDHYGGLPFIVRELAPREFWHGGVDVEARGYEDLLVAVRDGGTRSVRAHAGMTRRIGGCEVRVLGPPSGSRTTDLNDWSVVLRIACGRASILLPGDLEAAGEIRLLRQSSGLRALVLKAGHHGSRTSSTTEFLDAVRPRIAILSLGHDNRFGFPQEEVLATFRRHRIDVLRTDLHGAVIVEAGMDGELKVRLGRNQNGSKSVDSP